jgi:hypothetical protein
VIETGHRTDPLMQAVAYLAASYRALPQSKLLGLLPDGSSRAEAGYRFAAMLAVFGQGVEERTRDVAPAWRRLPFDGLFVVGDQIAVTGHDLVAEMDRLEGQGQGQGQRLGLDELVWTVGGERVRAGEVLEAAVRGAEELRQVM